MTSSEMSSAQLPDDRGPDQRDERSEAKLSEAQMSDAQMSEAQLSDAQMSEAQLSDAQASDAQLSDAQASDAQLSDAQASKDTARPEPGGATAADSRMPLLEADELQSVISRWREIQAEFVDQPKRAMQDADSLVSELMERLTRRFAEEHERLEARWSEEERISTEDLRQGLQRYRSFFERLLAA